jgi:hypothetical protein
MKRIIVLLTAALVLTLVVAVGVVSAPTDDVPPHQHYLVKDEKVKRVGPNVCDNPNAQQGFNNFHHNVHVDPDHPADIRATGCGEPAPSP